MYGSSYSLFESNWNHGLSYLFVIQISHSIIILLSLYVGFASQRRAIVHGSSLIQM